LPATTHPSSDVAILGYSLHPFRPFVFFAAQVCFSGATLTPVLLHPTHEADQLPQKSKKNKNKNLKEKKAGQSHRTAVTSPNGFTRGPAPMRRRWSLLEAPLRHFPLVVELGNIHLLLADENSVLASVVQTQTKRAKFVFKLSVTPQNSLSRRNPSRIIQLPG
jgi:hypothetical protein